jgi:hypothetical protein
MPEPCEKERIWRRHKTTDNGSQASPAVLLQLSPLAEPGKSRGMAKRRRVAFVRRNQSFKGRQFTAEVILWARPAKGSVRRSRMEGQGEGVRWYLMFPVSYRDLELTLQDRGVEVDHITIFR